MTLLKTLIDYCHIFNYKAIASQTVKQALFCQRISSTCHTHGYSVTRHGRMEVLSHLQNDKSLEEMPVHILSTLQTSKCLQE